MLVHYTRSFPMTQSLVCISYSWSNPPLPDDLQFKVSLCKKIFFLDNLHSSESNSSFASPVSITKAIHVEVLVASMLNLRIEIDDGT